MTVEVDEKIIAAAWATWHSRHGGKLGPGPAFVEAISAAILAYEAAKGGGEAVVEFPGVVSLAAVIKAFEDEWPETNGMISLAVCDALERVSNAIRALAAPAAPPAVDLEKVEEALDGLLSLGQLGSERKRERAVHYARSALSDIRKARE